MSEDNKKKSKNDYKTVYADMDMSDDSCNKFSNDNETENNNKIVKYNNSIDNDDYFRHNYSSENHDFNTIYKNKDETKIFMIITIIFAFAIVVVLLSLVWFTFKSGKRNNVKKQVVVSTMITNSIDVKESVSQTHAVTTTTSRIRNEVTTKILTDTEKNGYDEFITNLVVRVDEAGKLPLRDVPDRDASEIIDRIPDGDIVDVLGYKNNGSEVWFRVEYAGKKGWCRGGMLQPYDIYDLYSDLYNRPGLDEWKNKFQLKEPSSVSFLGEADFKGTLYYIPDLSSGVQRRFKSSISVDVYSKYNEWYYVVINDDQYYEGWVHNSQLSF